ncbi:hypothetical protein [Pseudarthrobacter sp. J47]|uniref:hypothetical protein n=1 Tax=Pseudarthrobacter sp. J47 TaxID=3116482 RepID=UPI002E819D5E|nr:hypothetical protein [Pseudarthrobacter sp. J47]MEE2524494.1 hypothetical protein [Pseudarthrobacter sp. J47]
MDQQRIGRTYTKAFSIETRQHELLGYDLGEGAQRRHLRLGLAAAAVWIALMIPILQAPNQITASIYLIPPGVFIALGVQMDPRQPRRMRVSSWLLSLMFTFSGHQPIVNMGNRKATKNEQITWRERSKLDALATNPLTRPALMGIRRLLGMPPLPFHKVRHTTADHSGPVGKPIVLAQSDIKIYGADYLHEMIAKRAARRRKGRKS